MLSERTIDKINRQIIDELRTVDGSFTPHQEKMEAIERIAALKALFTEEEKPDTNDNLVHEICEILRNRRR